MKKSFYKRGITLAEILIAALLTLLVIGIALELWYFTQRAWFAERTKSKILGYLEIGMERMKKEIRGSNADEVFFYPSTASVYSAISLPIAVDDDGDGFIELDNNNTPQDPTDDIIDWDQTAIYHLYNDSVKGETQLRRTIFDPRLDMSSANRQDQLDTVVVNGVAISSTPNKANASTRVLISQPFISGNPSISLEITPKLREFDGYSSTVERSSNVSFGSIVLNAGYHDLKFNITGKNSLSGSYGLGVDLFKITPSGSNREGEDYTFLTHPNGSTGISGSSGDGITSENMSSYGNWSGDFQLDYDADEVGDFITLKFYNDAWRESIFDLGTRDLVIVNLSDRDGVFDSTTGYPDLMARLEGGGKTWEAADQTGGAKNNLLITPAAGGHTYRNVILGSYVAEDGRLLRIKFSAGQGAPLEIASAYICKRKEQQDPDEDLPQDGENPSGVITFNGGFAGVIIAAGGSVWSDWIGLGNNDNTDKSKDYLVTFYIPQHNGTQHGVTYWENSGWGGSAGSAYSYGQAGLDIASTMDWGNTTFSYGTPEGRIYCIEEVEVSYVDNGTFTSQVYDTGVANPNISSMTWDIVRDNYPDANLVLRVRSSDDESALLASSDWSGATAIDTQSATHGSANIGGVGTGRYVQFQADFTSVANVADEQTTDQYDMSCVLKDVAIYWPGESVACDLSGYFTLKPTYGIFNVEIDGQPLTKGLEITLTISCDVLGVDVTRSLAAEVEPRNTGK